MDRLHRGVTNVRKKAPMALEKDGFIRVGWVAVDPPSMFSVNFDLDEARNWHNAIYAFRVGGEVIRIGVAAILSQKMHQLEKDISHALAGEFRMGGPNPWEAYEWRRKLTKHRRGEFFAQQGPVNRVHAVNVERKLISKYDPVLCNDGPSGRKRPPEARMVRDVAEAKSYWKLLNSERIHPEQQSHR